MALTSAEFFIEQGKAEGIQQGIQQGIEQGKAEGIQQGIAEGEIRAKQDSVLKLLRYQFPDISDAVFEQINEIKDLSRLETLFEQALEAKTFADIDLDTHP